MTNEPFLRSEMALLNRQAIKYVHNEGNVDNEGRKEGRKEGRLFVQHVEIEGTRGNHEDQGRSFRRGERLIRRPRPSVDQRDNGFRGCARPAEAGRPVS